LTIAGRAWYVHGKLGGGRSQKKLPADPGFFVYHVLEMLIHTPVLSEAINQI